MYLVFPPVGAAVLHGCEMAAHRHHHGMTIVFESGYPFGCQCMAAIVVFFFVDFREVGRLAPAFITVILDTDPAPVSLCLLQYFATFAKDQLADHFCPVRGFGPERADGNATNCSDHCGKLKNEFSLAKFYRVAPNKCA